jgi:prepilin-type processing-associated H-X9-DG protein
MIINITWKKSGWLPQRAQSDAAAFTCTELFAVIATVALVVVTLLPAFAHSRPDAQTFQCLNNHKQLMLAWQVYAADHADRVPNNFTIPDTLNAITSGKLDNWANNVMTWGATTSTEDRSNTNELWIKNGVFGKYTGSSVRIYKCPSDLYLGLAQSRAGWIQRNRSISMNSLCGRSDRLASSTTGRSWSEGGAYRQFLKTSDVAFPAMTWVTVDEHPDSINEGFFVVPFNTSTWGDLPASLHDGACSFSFADGHVEVHKWLSGTSKYPVRFSFGPIRTFDAAGRQDFQWYKDRTGYILFR